MGYNMFAYCGNDPVNRSDPLGNEWWHWAIGAAIVAVCVVAVVVTAGGAAAGIGAVAAVVSGSAAATTRATIAAAATIGSASALGTAAMSAALTSDSIEEFNDQGDWVTVISTGVGALYGAYNGYRMSYTDSPSSSDVSGKGTKNPKVKAAIQEGQEIHKQMDYGPGTLKEVKISAGCRVDAIDMNRKIIYELKPNNEQGISRGIAQLARYTAAASQKYGGQWSGVLWLYE